MARVEYGSCLRSKVIVWVVLAVVALLTVSGVMFVGAPALEHRRHERTLRNIERLEIELGVGAAGQGQLEREVERVVIATDQRTQRQWEQRQASVFGDCKLCGRYVALDAGRCQLVDRAKCAKEIYRREL